MRLRIEGEVLSGDKVEVLQGWRSLPFGPTKAEQGWIGDVEVTDGSKALTVRAMLPGGRVERTVRLWPRQGALWLAQAQEQYETDQADQARRLLEGHKQEWQGTQAEAEAHGLDAVDWVRAALLWGNLTWETGPHEEAEAWFIKATQRAAQVGLPRDELESALWRDTILVRERDELEVSRRLLDELSGKVEQAWEQKVWLLFHQGDRAQRCGHLDEALGWLERGERAAHWLGDEEARITAHIFRAVLLEQLGRYHEADEEQRVAQELLDKSGNENQQCRLADVLETRAERFLSQREYERHKPRHWRQSLAATPLTGAMPIRALDESSDPMALLERAIKVRKNHCKQSRPQAMQALLRARAAILYNAQEDEVQDWFARARALSGPEGTDEGFDREWLALRGEWELERQRPEEAAEYFRQLLKRLAPQRTTVITQCGKEKKKEVESGSGKLAWRAWLGLAQALALREPRSQAALDAYAHARAVLWGNSITPPWRQENGSFWGLHEWGAFLEVDFLRRQGREDEALAVARAARLRALREALQLRWVENLDPKRRQEWKDKVQEYEQKRREWDGAANERQDDQQSQLQERRLRDEVLDKLRAVLGVLAPEDAMVQGVWREPDPDRVMQWLRPPPGEVQLHCFPLPEDWICWVTDSVRSVSSGLAEDTIGAPRRDPAGPTSAVPVGSAGTAEAAEKQHLKALSEAMTRLLERPAIARKLERAKRLKVAVYGELRNIDWTILPVGGHPLGERLKVVKMLDIPRIESPAGTHTDTGGTHRRATGKAPRGSIGAEGQADGGTLPDPPRALVVVDPARVARWPGTSPEKLGEMLRKGFDQRWHLTVISGQRNQVGGAGPGPLMSRGETPESGLRGQISSELGQTQRFIYLGPIATSPSTPLTDTGMPLQPRTGTPEQKEQAPGLRVTDILTLPRVPEGVVLLGCLGGLGLSEVGGLENLGLANAFLLRGSRWVIAAVRIVHPKITGRLAVALMEAGLAEPAADPGQVLQRAVDAVRKQGLKAGEEEDLNAFGVFVP